jgi:large subunit ribosomal protein L15
MLNKLEKISKNRKVIGRGGDRGGTSGKGHKGQKARSGGRVKAQFEGGQSPLTRRLPKRGFNNFNFRTEYAIVTLDQLNKISLENNFLEIDKIILVKEGIIKNVGNKVKILANGTVDRKITVTADSCSASAKSAIESQGGSVTLL